MDEQANQAQEDETGVVASQDEGAITKKRLRRVFGFVKSPAFWGGLVVGVIALGVGVALGWGAARWMDDDRHTDDDRIAKSTLQFEREGGDWPRKGIGEGKWDKDRKGRGLGGTRFADPRKALPDEIGERVEGLLRQAEEILETLAEYVESEENLDKFWDRFFESGLLGGDSWSEDGWKERFGGDYDKESGIPRKSAGGFREDKDGTGPLGRFGFSFEEILPGMAFWEECDIAWEDLPGALEGLDSFEGEENPQDFFEMIDQLFAEICVSFPDG